MSRLIDADALLQEFETDNAARNSDIWHITGIKAFIENAPTAFDTERVVEQLSCNSRFIDDINEHNIKCISCVIGQKTAINIVKKGGAV